MFDTNLNIAALIGSRICHDLISPLGAINNGLELLEMSGATGGPELSLITDSAAHANARIRFFRVAFGAGSDRDMSAAEVRSILSPLSREGRYEIAWHAEETLPRAEVQIGFLALLCAECALPRGGRVSIDRLEGCWHLRAEGTRISMNCDAWRLLEAPPELAAPQIAGLPPARVQFLLVPQLAAIQGRSVTLRQGEEHMALTV